MTGILLAIAGNSYGARPVNTAIPVISGTAAVGSTLSCSTGTWTSTTAISYTYQWQRGTTNISGATSSTYVIQSGDAGSTLRCVVTATNSTGSASANSANTAVVVSSPVNTVAPTISGTVSVGSTLTSSTGTWSGATPITYTYQWQRGTTNISGATSNTYTIQNADIGNTLRCVVTATNSIGSSSANSANTAIVSSAPINTVAPTVVGRYETGFTLSISLGTWYGYPTISYTYQWQRGTTNISGATSSTFTLTDTDVGSTIRCIVTGTNTLGSLAKTTASTVAIYKPPMAYGTAYGGGYFAGQISTSANGVATHNIVVAPKSSGEDYLLFQNNPYGTTGASSVIDGAANTTILASASPACPAGSFCSNLVVGGYSDWYLPSVYELSVCYWGLKPTSVTSTSSGYPNNYSVPKRTGTNISSVPGQTAATDFRSGGAQEFETTSGSYWSSTEAAVTPSDGAVTVFFGNGGVSSLDFGTQKGSNNHVRAIRKVAV